MADPVYHTCIINKSGEPYFVTIAGALAAIPPDQTERWTVLVHAGEYQESVTLGTTRENIDIVGVDRDGVVIAPATGDGITCNENNSIRNLTVKPAAGHGIILGDNCEVSNVTVQASGTDKHGIDLSGSNGARVENCHVEAADGYAMVLGDNCTVANVTAEALGTGRKAVRIADKTHVAISGCVFKGRTIGLEITNAVEDIQVASSVIRGASRGVWVWAEGQGILFQDCILAADQALGQEDVAQAFHVDSTSPDLQISIQGTRLEASCAGTSWACSVSIDQPCDLKLVECDLVAECTNTSRGEARGVAVGAYGQGVSIIGGAISTSAGAEKETGVWDLLSINADGWPAMSGTRCSKWKGPIKSAERPRPVIQRAISIARAAPDSILPETDLTEEETAVPLHVSLLVYRTVSVKGNQQGMNQDVYIRGTDWAGNDICENFTLNGPAVVAGAKPFKTVDTIWLPAESNGGQKVSVGTTNKLGLYHPISGAGDVIQQARKAPAADSYTIEAIGTVDATYATVDVGLLAADGYSFEWAILASS